MRCESDDAIEIGRAHGISLFQGYFLDHLLAEKITREAAAERPGAALARHRRTAATPQHAAGSQISGLGPSLSSSARTSREYAAACAGAFAGGAPSPHPCGAHFLITRDKTTGWTSGCVYV